MISGLHMFLWALTVTAVIAAIFAALNGVTAGILMGILGYALIIPLALTNRGP